MLVPGGVLGMVGPEVVCTPEVPMRVWLLSLFLPIFACAALLTSVGSTRCWGQAVVDTGLTVMVRDAAGGPIGIPALVRVTSPENPNGYITTTGPGGVAVMASLRNGVYTVIVTAAGYKPSHDEVEVLGSFGPSQCFITLEKDDVAGAEGQLPKHTGLPMLVGKSLKELELATAALRANKIGDAKQHIQYPLKHAPGDPEVRYIAGLVYLAQQDTAGAKQQFETAISIFPNHVGAHMALAGMAMQANDHADAIPHLEKALAVDSSAWRAHWMLAESYFWANHDTAKAKFQAEKAEELGKEKAVGAEITLALVENSDGDKDAARARLEKYIQEHPQDTSAPRARAILATWTRAAEAAHKAAAPVLIPIRPAGGAGLLEDVQPGSVLRLPAGIDDAVPPVTAGISCSLPQVLAKAEHRLSEFTEALERFTATENVLHEELDSTGITRKSNERAFQYVVELERPRPQSIIMDEMRDGRFQAADFPFRLIAGGVPAIALVFHPDDQEDFKFSCEGLSNWQGRPAWQVRFEQRQDRPPKIHEWIINDHEYPTHLKGRAWIDTGSSNILHIETDLLKPIPQIELEYEHMSIDYAPVKYPSGKMELWLPSRAIVYSRFRRHFLRQTHAYTNFTLFNIETKEKVKSTGGK